MREFFASLSKAHLKGDYSIKLSMFRDGFSNIPSTTHTFQGSIKCKILKLVAIFTMAVLFISSISALLSCMRD